jgi:hypothetical protein
VIACTPALAPQLEEVSGLRLPGQSHEVAVSRRKGIPQLGFV